MQPNETHNNLAPAHHNGDFAECQACGLEFAKTKAWQVWCSKECKRAFEDIISDYNRDTRAAQIKMGQRLAGLQIK